MIEEKFNEALARVNEMIAELEKQKQEIASKLGESELKPIVVTLKEKVPEFKYATWTQYTPYWNDGDTCEFSVNEVYIATTLEEDDDFDEWSERSIFEIMQTPEEMEGLKIRYNNAQISSRKYLMEDIEKANKLKEKYPEIQENLIERRKSVDEFRDFISNIPESIMLMAFGDHVRVTVNSDGSVEIDDYQHD